MLKFCAASGVGRGPIVLADGPRFSGIVDLEFMVDAAVSQNGLSRRFQDEAVQWQRE